MYNPYRTPTGAPVTPAGYVLRFPAYAVWTLWGFLVSWSATRDFRRLLQGLPALILAAVPLALLVRQGQPASHELIQRYRDRAQQATRDEEFELADFYFRKLELLAPGETRIRYDHALLHAAREDYVRAAYIMESLVENEDQSDDARIHLWLAQAALEGQIELENPLLYAKDHLNRLLSIEPHNRYAHLFYAQLFLRLNDPANAIRHLEPIASAAPDLQFQLALLYGMTGDEVRGRSLARSAANAFQKQINNTQASDATTWHHLASCHFLLEEYDDAVNVLKQAVTKFNDEPSRKLLGQAYARWSDAIHAKEPENISRRMELLQEALLVAPDDPLVLQRLVEIAAQEGPAADEARTELQRALAEGRGAGVIHFTLGTIEAGRGNMEAALRHLDQANSVNPNTAATLNNLAFVLAKQESPDLERALDMIDQAIRISPDVPSFHETRGQILTLLERYPDAITDLEHALPHISDLNVQIAIHQSLAKCYSEIGSEELQEIHADKAKTLQDQLSKLDSETPPASLEDLERIFRNPPPEEKSSPGLSAPVDTDR